MKSPVQTVHDGPNAIINMRDHVYQYDDPDTWRLPLDTDKIPYEFSSGRTTHGRVV